MYYYYCCFVVFCLVLCFVCVLSGVPPFLCFFSIFFFGVHQICMCVEMNVL